MSEHGGHVWPLGAQQMTKFGVPGVLWVTEPGHYLWEKACPQQFLVVSLRGLCCARCCVACAAKFLSH